MHARRLHTNDLCANCIEILMHVIWFEGRAGTRAAAPATPNDQPRTSADGALVDRRGPRGAARPDRQDDAGRGSRQRPDVRPPTPATGGRTPSFFVNDEK